MAPALFLCGAACLSGASRGPALHQSLTISESTIRLVYQPADAGAARDVVAALPAALVRAGRWGTLREPITVTLHPTHEALEAAVQRAGYRWMRGWARYATIDLQSPRTWQLFAPGREHLEQTLAHELTHCVMYQASGTSWSWPYKGIPLWFREGMASVTAGETLRRSAPERVAAFYDGSPAVQRQARGDPLSDPEPLYQREDDLVYATAHLAFQFLLDRYGAERVRRLLAAMGEGDLFAGAFRRAIGIGPDEFEADFRRCLAWRGFR